MNLVRAEPLKSSLDIPSQSSSAVDILWPGEADPEAVRITSHAVRKPERLIELKVSDHELRDWLRKTASSNNHQVFPERSSSWRLGLTCPFSRYLLVG